MCMLPMIVQPKMAVRMGAHPMSPCAIGWGYCIFLAVGEAKLRISDAGAMHCSLAGAWMAGLLFGCWSLELFSRLCRLDPGGALHRRHFAI